MWSLGWKRVDVFVPVSQFIVTKKVIKACLPYVDRLTFYWAGTSRIQGMGKVPAGLFIWKQISYSSSATFFLIHLKAQLVLSPVVVFTEHSHYTKHDTHSSTLAWQITWTEEPGGLLSTGSLAVRHD